MMKDKLNILHFGYYKKFSFHTITQFFRNIKYAVQRIKWGFCAPDTWNLYDTLPTLIEQELIYFRDHMHGYPNEFGSAEEWSNHLTYLIELFHQAQEDNIKNPYWDDFVKVVDAHSHIEIQKDGTVIDRVEDNYTSEEEEIRKKYLKFEEKKAITQSDYLRGAFKELAEVIEFIWD